MYFKIEADTSTHMHVGKPVTIRTKWYLMGQVACWWLRFSLRHCRQYLCDFPVPVSATTMIPQNMGTIDQQDQR